MLLDRVAVASAIADFFLFFPFFSRSSGSLAMDEGGYFLCILFTSHGRGWLFLMYIIY